MMMLAAIIAGATISGQGDGAFVSSGFVTALLGTGGVAGLIGYLGGRKHRVTVEPSICEERHKLLEKQIENIYSRINTLESNNSAHTAQLKAIESRVESMDGKLDCIISKMG